MSAQASITVTARGTTASNASSSTTFPSGIIPSGTLAAGNTGVLCVSADNAGNNLANMPASVTDSQGNVWYLIREAVHALTAGAGCNVGEYFSLITTPLTASDNIPFTFTLAVTAKTALIWEVAPSAGNRVIPLGGGQFKNNAYSASGAPTLTSTDVISNGILLMAFGGVENSDIWTADANATNGTYSTSQHTGIGTGAAGQAIISQYKIVTAGGATQTYAPTTTGTPDGILMIGSFEEVDDNLSYLAAEATSNTSTILKPRRTLAVGSLGVLCIAGDNFSSGTNFAAGPLTDSVGNSWTKQQGNTRSPSGGLSGLEIAIYTAPITTALTPLDNVTTTYGSAITSKTFAIWELRPVGVGPMSVVTGATGIGTSATPTISTTSITSGDTVVGMGGGENTDSWTGVGGSWSTQGHTGFSAGLAGIALTTQILATTSTGTQTYNPTQSGADDYALAWISVHDASPTNTSTAFLNFFP